MARTSRGSRRTVEAGVVTVTATCKLPTGRTRTVQRNGKRSYPDPILKFAEAAAGANPVTGAQGVFGDMVLGGADSISGDIYVSGNVHLRGEGTVTGYDTPDPPAITVAPGKAVTSTSSRFDAAAAGASGPGQITPLPVLSNAQGGGIIDKIRLAVTNRDGTPMMTGTYQNATVYNLGEIFAQLGATNEGNRERNLARPEQLHLRRGELGCEVPDLAGSRDPRPQASVRVLVLRARVRGADGQAELLLHGIAAEPVESRRRARPSPTSTPRPSVRARS